MTGVCEGSRLLLDKLNGRDVVSSGGSVDVCVVGRMLECVYCRRWFRVGNV